MDNWIYEDETISFTVKDGVPDWTDITRNDMERVLLETGAWEQDEVKEYDLDRLQAVVIWLMEGRYENERCHDDQDEVFEILDEHPHPLFLQQQLYEGGE